MDADGMDVRSAYVQPSEGTISQANRVSKGRSGGRNKSQTAFRSALRDAVGEFGRSEPEGGSGGMVQAVDMKKVRDKFTSHYKANSQDPDKRVDAARNAFNRAIKEAVRSGEVQQGRWRDVEWVYELGKGAEE